MRRSVARASRLASPRFWGTIAIVTAAIVLPLPDATGKSIGNLPSVCIWQNLFHFSCPGCGLCRSIVCLGHGEFSRALSFHPLGPLFFLVILAVGLSQNPIRLTGKLGLWTAIAAFVLFIGVWVLRLATHSAPP
jgi:hypothetical protein